MKKVENKKTVAKKTATRKNAKKSVESTLKKVDDMSVKLNEKTTGINPEFTDSFIKEVDEDVKNDNFKVLWNRYGIFVIAFVVIAVSAAVFFDRIKAWKIEQTIVRTESYMNAMELSNKPEETIAALQKINQQGRGIFSDFAKLQIANILFSQQKTEEALATLENMINDKQVNYEVRNIALIKYATYKVDSMPKAELEALLKPIFEANNSWVPMANDLLALVAIRDGDIQTAKDIYNNLLKVKDLPDSFRNKVQDMLSSINDM